MADTHVAITGNLTEDPEVTFTPNGAAVCNFRLAVTPRIKQGDLDRRRDVVLPDYCLAAARRAHR
jgi:single-strand DNA-binding protein